jgi:1-acyl-sn-glycerol-3-phosphate acyltransferase
VAAALAWALTGAQARWVGCRPEAGQRVYFANHTSHGDFVLVWTCLPAPLRASTRPVAARDYWTRGALRRYLIREVFRGVLVDRDRETRVEDPVEAMVRALDEGASLILFPEGTRNTGDGMLPFRGGIFHVARARPQVEFVPVWIENLNRVMPKGELLPVPLLCSATFGSPTRIADDEEKGRFLARLRQAMLDLGRP